MYHKTVHQSALSGCRADILGTRSEKTRLETQKVRLSQSECRMHGSLNITYRKSGSTSQQLNEKMGMACNVFICRADISELGSCVKVEVAVLGSRT